MAAKIKKGDKVIVLAGKDKGKQGQVVSVDPVANKAVVSDVNVVLRHTRQSQTSRGGRIPKPMPLHLSNLALIDPVKGVATRVGFRQENGQKKRYAKKSGDVIDVG